MTPNVLVVKLGGTTIGESDAALADVSAAARERPVVVVHGGGARLTEWLDRLGVPTRFEHGRRVTDDAALEVAWAVLGGLVNGEVVQALSAHGTPAIGVTGVDGGLLRGERVPGLGRVARIASVDRELFGRLLSTGRVVVVAPLAPDESGVVCNVNADEAAAGIAAGLEARDAVFLTDVDGARAADGARIRVLTPEDATELISNGTIHGGMIPKVEAAVAALGAPPRSGAAITIADGRRPRALAAVLAGEDVGTRLVAGPAAATPALASATPGIAASSPARAAATSAITATSPAGASATPGVAGPAVPTTSGRLP